MSAGGKPEEGHPALVRMMYDPRNSQFAYLEVDQLATFGNLDVKTPGIQPGHTSRTRTHSDPMPSAQSKDLDARVQGPKSTNSLQRNDFASALG